MLKFSVASTEIIKCALLSAHAARNNGFVDRMTEFLAFVFFFHHFLGRNSRNLLAGRISAFRVSWVARLINRLSLINALTSARVWNGDPVKGAVECSRVNFYRDLNKSMWASASLSLVLSFSFFFFVYGLNKLSRNRLAAVNFSLQIDRDTRYVRNWR